jgi:hypothetical protein
MMSSYSMASFIDDPPMNKNHPKPYARGILASSRAHGGAVGFSHQNFQDLL